MSLKPTIHHSAGRTYLCYVWSLPKGWSFELSREPFCWRFGLTIGEGATLYFGKWMLDLVPSFSTEESP